MSPVNPDNFDTVVAAINKKYENDLRNGDTYEHPQRLSTRSLALDYAMGGGLPLGRISRLYGPYCLAPATLVLRSDFKWVPVESLSVGMTLVGFDEYPQAGRGQTRRLRGSVVEANDRTELVCRRITTDRGTETVASMNHLWLVSSVANGHVDWKKTCDLSVGDKIIRFATPWADLVDTHNREKAAYLGGLFDGEGWIDNRRVAFAQNPGLVLDRGQRYLKDLGFSITDKMGWTGKSDVVKTTVKGGNPEIMRFFSQIPTGRLRHNAASWWEGNSMVPKGPWVAPGNCIATVTELSYVGKHPVQAIQTSTKTLIADGMMSHNSSTKSLTGWNIVAEAQKEGLICCYWNVEKSYDPEFVEENCGVDTADLLVMEETKIEMIADKLSSLMGVVHLHILDSCSAASSVDELEADVTAWRPGIRARAWGKSMAHINEYFDATGNTLVLLDQVRTNFKTSSEDPPGGRVLDHASSMSVKFKKGSWLQRNAAGNLVTSKKGGKGTKADNNDMEQPPGIEIKARIEKSRVCRPLIPAEMHLDLETIQFDRTFEYMEMGKAVGVFEVRGGGNYYYPAVATSGKAQQRLFGEDALRAFIDMSPKVRREIRTAAMKIARRR